MRLTDGQIFLRAGLELDDVLDLLMSIQNTIKKLLYEWLLKEMKIINPVEKVKVECPVCEKRFRDKRGLTSHARHFHEMGKEEIEKARIKKDEKEDSTAWKIVGGVGALLLAIITAGRFR